MSKDEKYIIYCRHFGNLHDDFIYTCGDLDSAKELFKLAMNEYYKYLIKLGLCINEIFYEGPRTTKEFEERLPSIIFITDDHLMFEVEMVADKKSRKFQASL